MLDTYATIGEFAADLRKLKKETPNCLAFHKRFTIDGKDVVLKFFAQKKVSVQRLIIDGVTHNSKEDVSMRAAVDYICDSFKPHEEKNYLKNTRMIYHSDPGHAWLEVSFCLLKELGIEDEISAHSYVSGGKIFLECDCDAKILTEKLNECGIVVKPEIKRYDDFCHIRNLPFYQPPETEPSMTMK